GRTPRAADAAADLAAALGGDRFRRPPQGRAVPADWVVQVPRAAREARAVVCSSAGNHAQGVALAAALLGVRAVVVMAENATPSKIEATRGYGAEVVLHGTIWDEADAKARE